MANKRFYVKKISGLILLISGAIGIQMLDRFNETSWELLYVLLGSVFAVSYGISALVCRERLIPNVARIVTGIIFTYSGFVKAVDPLGSKYKFIDYFDAWGMNYMEPLALTLGILLGMAEFLVGISLLFNTLTKYASIGALLFMIFFTPVTLYLALQEQTTGKELVHDCGCFGDALILTNWQTFVKNIIIFIPVLILFFYRKQYLSIFVEKVRVVLVILFATGCLGISFWALRHLPQIDFRPYKVGTHIPDQMIIPEGAPQPVYSDPVFILKKGDVVKEFSMENYPTEPGWEYVDRKIELIDPGYIPPIHDFTITSDSEGDITEKVLSDQKYNFLIVAYDLNSSCLRNQKELNKLYIWAAEKGFAFRCLTASVDADIKSFKEKSGAKYPFYSTDPVTLKTIVRANPGIVLLKGGTIINKWHHGDLPGVDQFEKIVE